MGGPCRLKTPGKLGKAGPAATDNFQLRRFVLDGREYQSVEQAYQALKFGNAPKHEGIRALRPRIDESASSHGMRCWNAGQTGRGIRDDWDVVKVEVMLRCCRAKCGRRGAQERRTGYTPPPLPRPAPLHSPPPRSRSLRRQIHAAR